MRLLPEEWRKRLERIDFAFQPIVNIHTGVSIGCEALLRNFKAAGFSSIFDVFDHAFREDLLCQVDLALMEKAIRRFLGIESYSGRKLFYNVDCRIWDDRNYHPEKVCDHLQSLEFPFDALCLELTERNSGRQDGGMFDRLRRMKARGFKIAVDDCGTGFNGLGLMYQSEPDFIKIDRFFIQDMSRNVKKRLFVSSIVNISHLIGSIVIGEGIENKSEYYTCREIGCDMIQGWLVAPPQEEHHLILSNYSHIDELGRQDRRKKYAADQKYIRSWMRVIEPLPLSSSILNIFNRFNQKQESLIPIVNEAEESVGIVSEASFKVYIYSRYGRELLENPAFKSNISRFVHKCPTVDINTPVEKILEIYSQDDSVDGVLIVENMKYAGFLDAQSLLKAINEKNISQARDQNPLTSLPGNTLIHEYLTEAIENRTTPYVVVYFDMDNFKAYNDRYGFRNGDRVLTLFADILKRRQLFPNMFVGHIGGDDFFMGVQDCQFVDLRGEIEAIMAGFKSDVESYYDLETLKQGFVLSIDRDGIERQFPLLTVSAAVLELEGNRSSGVSISDISEQMAVHKKKAKRRKDKISFQAFS